MKAIRNEHEVLVEAARLQAEPALRSANADTERISGRFAADESLPGYRIHRAVHRGGQGVVYQAVQKSTGRTVAVKVMRDRPFGSIHDRTRFEREVQILGQLDHPNIVRIIDSGELDGRHFFVMDYIDGVPLNQFTHAESDEQDSQRRSEEDPDPTRADPGLPAFGRQTRRVLHNILQLFANVCDAVHAAHLRGVIHRDLKPGNILVDAEGRPHVLDFGLAKRFAIDESDATSMTVMTETGQFLGSLPWASPEQVSSDASGIDIRSDVYSLGVILYQLLTGIFPYRVTGSIREVTDNILSVDPARPSTISRHIDDEVETIVLKTLSKDPHRRYQSAGDLACDVRHYLAGELIEAKRDSLSYVLRKQLQRYWIPATFGAVLLLVLAAGLILSISLWRSAAFQRDQKETQRARAESVNTFLNTMLGSADPEIAQGRELTVRHTLDEATRQLDSGALEGQLDVEATVRLTMGKSYRALGEYPRARVHLEKSLAIRSRLVGERHADYAEAVLALAWLSMSERDNPAAIRLGEQARDIYQAVYRGDHPALAECLSRLAEYHFAGDELKTATDIKQQSLEMLQRLYGEEHPEVALSKARLAGMLHDPVRAEPMLRQALDVSRRTLGENHPQVASLHRQLGGTLIMARKHDEALEILTQAVALYRRVFGELSRETLHCQMDLAFAGQMAGDLRLEAQSYRDALHIARAIYGNESFGVAETLIDFAQCLHRSGEIAAALEAYEQALAILKTIKRDHESLGALTRLCIANYAMKSRDFAQAESLAQEILEFLPDQSISEQWMRAHARSILGGVRTHEGDYEAAEEFLLEAYEVLSTNRAGALIKKHKDAAAQRLVELYEAWEVVKPNTGKAALAAQWRSRLDASYDHAE